MIEVHHLNNSRSQRILWLLEELALPYTIVTYERDPATMLAPATAKAIHPLGKFPVIRDGEVVIAESAVILEYLNEHHAQGRLAPANGTRNHERHRYWMHYAEGSLMPQLLLKLYMARVGDSARVLADRIDAQIRMHLEFIEGELGDTPFFVGDDLTLADIQMSFPLEVAKTQHLLENQPRLSSFIERVHARPSYRRALARGGPYAFAQD